MPRTTDRAVPSPRGARRAGRAAPRRVLVAGVAAAAALAVSPAAVAGPSGASERKGPPPVEVQLLALNDFHGNLEPPGGSSGRINPTGAAGGDVLAGGAEYLATQLELLESEVKKQNTITVAAGDLIGASPLLSAAFRDEPTIEALSAAGLDYASVGNHEFDEGADELVRIQEGGCHPVDGCYDPERPYQGAGFQYLSANAFVTETGEPLLAPYAIHKVQGVRVGFIGMTLEGTPSIVSQAGIASLTFADEVETANRYAAELQEQGVEAIVVLLHEGGVQAGGGGINTCNGLTGPIVDIANGFDDAIDVVVSGHTHQAYNCVVDGKVVTSASSFGRLVTDIDLTIDRRTGDVLTATAENVVVSRDVEADAGQTALIARYQELLGPVAAEPVGIAPTPITRTQEQWFQVGTSPTGQPVYALGESPLGNLIADAQLAASDSAQIAFLNPGGVRADIPDAGTITYAEAFAVQPFNNYVVTFDLTGAQIQCLLEQQFTVNRTLYPSAGFTYSVDPGGTTAPAGNPCAGTRVPDSSVALNGTPLDPAATYRVTANSFLADGGDGFSIFASGTSRVVGGLDIDAFTDYLPDDQPVAVPATDRITLLP